MTTKIALNYTRKQVSRAGNILAGRVDASEQEMIAAYEVLQNFRGAHTYPIKTFQTTLRNRLKSIDGNALIAQRLKRTPSIVEKLLRFPEMNLARMQDIGGIRAIVNNLDSLYKICEIYLDETSLKHRLIGVKDYIKQPKPSGYRGVHLIYKYENKVAPEYNGLQIELQIRTRLQHAWATSVEIVGTYLDHPLKSNQGPQDWLSFFSLVGSAFACIEKCSPVPDFANLTKQEVFQIVARESKRLSITDKLKAFTVATKHIIDETSAASYHLIVLDPNKKTVSVRSFGRRKLDEANKAYAEMEKEIDDGSLQVVLVAADSMIALKQAYPNYFLDTHEFLTALSRIEAEAQMPASNLLSQLLRKL